MRSDFKRRSFELNFELVQTLATVYLFAGIEVLKTAKEIAEYVGFVTGAHISLLGLLRRLKGEKPKSTTTLSNGNIEITIDGDDNKVIVVPEVYKLASDSMVRKAVDEILRPLHTDGVDTFEVRDDRLPVETIKREDLPAFEVPVQLDRPISDVDEERTVALEVIKPSFEDTLTWVFSDGGGGRLNALMLDKSFLARVQAGRTFAKGDVLRVRVRTRSYLTSEGLRTDHAVLEVIQEINQPRQYEMLPIPQFERSPMLPAKAKKPMRKTIPEPKKRRKT